MSKFAEALAPLASKFTAEMQAQNVRNAAWQAVQRAQKAARKGNKEPISYSVNAC